MISLVVPSRGRPGRIRTMWESAKTTAYGRIEILMYLDSDDPMYYQYPNIGWRVVGPRIVLSQAWNEAAKSAQGKFLMLAGDDLIFRTDGWDSMVKAVAEQFPDGIAMIHTNDGFQNEALCTHPIVTRKWYETVGMMCPPYFTADYNDVWIHEVADRIGRRIYLPEVLIEHIHPDAGKIEMDRTYYDQRVRRVEDSMPEVYDRYAHERGEWADKLRGAMWAPVPTDSSSE